jgi:hypothetical protein
VRCSLGIRGWSREGRRRKAAKLAVDCESARAHNALRYEKVVQIVLCLRFQAEVRPKWHMNSILCFDPTSACGLLHYLTFQYLSQHRAVVPSFAVGCNRQ